MVKAVVIDDVQKIRESIKDLLQKKFPSITFVGEADNVKSGVALLSTIKPDIVFLDVEMPDGTGFDLLTNVQLGDAKIIFITAYEDYAIKAIKYSVIDYLLKPVDVVEFSTAVNKALTELNQRDIKGKLDTLLENIKHPVATTKKIILKTADFIYSLYPQEIIRCEAESNYTRFYLKNEPSILVSKTLGEYDEVLSNEGFFRVHASHIINLNHFSHYSRQEGGMIVMSDKSEVPLSKRKRDSFFEMIEQKVQ